MGRPGLGGAPLSAGLTTAVTREPLCSALAQHADHPVEGIIGYINPPLTPEPTDPAPPSHPPVTPGPDEYTAGTWFYQTCTEVGFFRIPNPNATESIMSDLMTVDISRAQCGWWAHQQPKLEETRAKYLKPIADGATSMPE